jgi:hypothetical protein
MDLEDIIDLAQQKGWRVKTGNGHKQVFSPDGKSIVTVAGTPSDYRALLNIKADFKRAGLDMNPQKQTVRTPPGMIDKTLREIFSARPTHVFPVSEVVAELKKVYPSMAEQNISTHVTRLVKENVVKKTGYAMYQWDDKKAAPVIAPSAPQPPVAMPVIPSSAQGMDADMVRFNELADQLVSVVTQMQDVMGRARGVLSQIAALRAALLPTLAAQDAPRETLQG